MPPQLQHTLAAALLEVAYLAAGLVLCYFGKEMLEKGLTSGFRADGSVASTKWRVATSSPGLVFMLAGLVIIALAIRTQANFESPLASGPEPSLDALAKQVVISRFADSSPEQAFADGQLAAARSYLEQENRESAVLSLVNAVVVRPAALRAVLDDQDLRTLTSEPAFVAIVRRRFELPVNVTSVPDSAEARRVLVQLGMFAQDQQAEGDVSAVLAQVPREPEREPVAATAERLRAALGRNPRALYDLLQAPEYGWVLRNPRLIEELRSGIESLESTR